MHLRRQPMSIAGAGACFLKQLSADKAIVRQWVVYAKVAKSGSKRRQKVEKATANVAGKPLGTDMCRKKLLTVGQ
jgi:hypothetical protein